MIVYKHGKAYTSSMMLLYFACNMHIECLIWSLLCYLCITYVCATINPIVEEEQVLWVSGEQAEIKEYRTPILISTPPGDILAFAGARKYSTGDVSAKMITMRRSSNGGSEFNSTLIVVDDGGATPDGLNLGNIIIDQEENSIIMLYCFCVRDKCNPKRPASTFMTKSYDWGYTWSPPVDLAEKSKFFMGWHWCPGPGYGIQKMHAPKKGRLIACGHSVNFVDMIMTCIYSDDHGMTWTKGAEVIGLPYNEKKQEGDFSAGEPQMVELPNGTLLCSIRNELHFHCSCRMWLTSTDGGETFPIKQLRFDPTLIDPPCQGSVLIFNNITYFSNPASTSHRVNMTLRWSLDFGMTWAGELLVYSGGSGYSCLAPIDMNHIGLLYEKDGCKEMSFVKIRLDGARRKTDIKRLKGVP